MPLRTQLNNGDQVEIVTSKAQTPNPTWERFVVTGRARSRIRRFIRTQQRAQYVDLGRAILVRAFRSEGYDFTDKAVDGVLKIFKASSVDDVIAMVGEGTLTAREVVSTVFPELKARQPHPDNVVPISRKPKLPGDKRDLHRHAVPIKGLIAGMAVHFAGCCHPLPGDRIVGIVTTGKGVTIHTIDCENLEQYADTPERWLDLSWDDADGQGHLGRIDLVVTNEPGTLGAVTTVIAKNMGNITNLKLTNRTVEFFELIIDIEVRDVKHLTNIIAALRATPAISSVERARN